MTDNILVKIFEHNNWANQKIIDVCLTLSDEQLDAEPQSAVKGSIRTTLIHFVMAQRSYLSLLTLPSEKSPKTLLEVKDLKESAQQTGAGMLAIVKGEQTPVSEPLQMGDEKVASWVLMVQTINHATEHREQIKSMLTALGIEPPDIDGWTYAESIKK